MDDLIDAYQIVKGKKDQLPTIASQMVDIRKRVRVYRVIKTAGSNITDSLLVEPVTLEDILIYYHRKSQQNEKPAL